MVEVREGRDHVKGELGSNYQDEIAQSEAHADVLCHYFSSHFTTKWLGADRLAAGVTMSSQGKPDDDGVDDLDYVIIGPDIDENELIDQKTEFEKKFILKHRSLFSESLSLDRYI